jgi:hypothetical protein
MQQATIKQIQELQDQINSANGVYKETIEKEMQEI